jgi:hypothetical protein
MDALTIRQKLHEYINEADDKEVEVMFAMIKNEEPAPYEWWNDDELIAELDRRAAALKSGEDKGIPLEDAVKHLLDRLK